jgi:hypothetical protein
LRISLQNATKATKNLCHLRDLPFSLNSGVGINRETRESKGLEPLSTPAKPCTQPVKGLFFRVGFARSCLSRFQGSKNLQ